MSEFKNEKKEGLGVKTLPGEPNEEELLDTEKESPHNTAEPTLEISVGSDVDYVFRDTLHVFAGLDEVLLEFGNRDRLREHHLRISNRIVLTTRDAYRLAQQLDRALAEMHLQRRQESNPFED